MNLRALMRQLNLPLEFLLQADETTFLWATEKLEKDAVLARRTVVYGACLAAGTALQAERVQRAAGRETPHLVCVQPEAARKAFQEASRMPPEIDDLQAIFRPVAILHDESLRGNHCGFLFLDDAAASGKILKALTAVTLVRQRQIRVLGEIHLVPPALPWEGRSRRRWIQQRGVEPPSSRERGGPYWRLGKHNLWRLPVLSWSERLALAALVGTALPEAILLAPSRLMPRVGYVTEAAREMGRTFIGVPLETCPPRLRGPLRLLQTVNPPHPPSMFDAAGGDR